MSWKPVFDSIVARFKQPKIKTPSRFHIIGSKPKHIILGYIVSAALVGIATLLRLGLDPVLGEHHPFTLYFAAVAVASWYGGFGPGILAIVASYFAADWFFISPRFEFNLPRTDLDEFMALMAFLFSGVAIAFTTKLMREALDKARRKQQELETEIQERKRAEEALKTAQKQLREHATRLEDAVQERTAHLEETIRSLEGVCYHLAHDLRAPLRAMEGYTGILAKDLGPALDQTATRYLENISEAAQRMDWLIGGLLEYGTLGHAQFPVRPLRCDTIFDNVIHELTPRIVAANARVHLPEAYPELFGNEKLLELVFLQILKNALTFVTRGVSPVIYVRFETRSGAGHDARVRCWIEDNGIGIPAERSHKAFWIFERLHPGSSYPGIGMGLALASKAIERMHGKIGVEAGEECGSRFWFELPAAHPEAHAEEQGQMDSDPRVAREKSKSLAV